MRQRCGSINFYPDSVVSAEAVFNSGSDTLWSFITVGGLLADADSNPAHIAVTQDDIKLGYNKSYVIGRASSALLLATVTRGASLKAASLGTAGQIAAYGIQGLDFLNNLRTAADGIADARKNGLGFGNGFQIFAGMAGVHGNLSTITRGIPAAARAADDVAAIKRGFAQPKVAPLEPVYNPQTRQLKVLQDFCFAPETLIATPNGPRQIGEIRKGDSVLAFDHHTGQWSEQRVAVFHESVYEGPLLTITTEAGSVRCTVYHPFWVVAGRDLGERSTPRELEEHEDQGQSLDGRWVNSHELRCGDRLIGQDGKLRTVLRIEQEYVQAFVVHNLTIDEQHTFAVGPDGVLVHNTASCPSPNGRNGNLPHQTGVNAMADDIASRGLRPKREYYVPTPDGRLSGRFVDVAGIDPETGLPVEFHQIGKRTKGGVPVSRERYAMQDILDATGLSAIFTPYN